MSSAKAPLRTGIPVLLAAVLFAAPTDSRAQGDTPPKHYRRRLSLANFDCSGSVFRRNDKGALEAAGAGVGAATVRLERELPPGEYAVCLSVPTAIAIDKAATAMAANTPPALKGKTLDMADNVPKPGALELPPRGPSSAAAPGATDVRLQISLGANMGELRFPHGGEEPLHAVTIPCKTAFDTVAIQLLSPEKRLVIGSVCLTANPRDIALRRKTLGIAGPERDLFLDIHTLAVRQSERGVLRTADSPEPPNHVYNGSFEAGCPSPWWCTPYQAQVAVTPTELVQTDCPDGGSALVVPLMPHVYRRPAVRVADPAPATKAASKDDELSDLLDSLEEPQPLMAPGKIQPVKTASYKSLPLSLTLCHRALKLRPNSPYTFRALLRPNTPATVSVNVETSYGELTKVGSATKGLPSDAWTPVTLDFSTVDDNRGYDLTLELTCRVPSEELQVAPVVALDAVQVSPVPTPGGFTPAAPVEVGVTWNVPGKVFHREEGVDLRLAAGNAGVRPGEVHARYRVFDYFNALVAEGTVGDWTLPAGATGERKLPLEIEHTGAFRLLVDGTVSSGTVSVDIPLQEYAFCVLPRPPAHVHGTFGTYSTLTTQPAAILGRTSIRRVVTLSNMNELLCQWGCINPLPEYYVWADDLVANARTNGITVVANLDLARGVPEFAANPQDKEDAARLSKGTRVLAPARWSRQKAGSYSKRAWSIFVERMVTHYKADIRDWLIIDEPYRFMSMPQYAELLRLAVEAIKRADPDARVLIHGAYYANNLAALEKLGCLDLVDGIHDYDRDAGKGALLQETAARHNLELHTVEYNGHRSIYQTIETTRPNWDTDFLMGFYRSNTATLAMQAIQRMAWARATTFSRNGAAYPGGDFLQFSGYKSLYEYDGALKPCGVAYAMAASLLDGFRGAGQLATHDKLETYMMETDDRFCLVFGSKVGGKAVRFSLPAGVRCLDIMGNPVRIAPRRQWLGPDICYAIGPRSVLKETKAMLTGLTFDDVYKMTGRSELNETTGQYERHVTVLNLLPDEPIEAWVGCRTAFVSWARARPMGHIDPEGSATAVFGLNAFRGEERVPQGGEYVYVHALGGSKY